jgi:hypothetical protein
MAKTKIKLKGKVSVGQGKIASAGTKQGGKRLYQSKAKLNTHIKNDRPS